MSTLTQTADETLISAAPAQAIDFLGLTMIPTALKRLVAFVQAERHAAQERRRITRELNTYTTRELAELGLSRLDIPAVAAGNYGA